MSAEYSDPTGYAPSTRCHRETRTAKTWFAGIRQDLVQPLACPRWWREFLLNWLCFVFLSALVASFDPRNVAERFVGQGVAVFQ